jgi:hypothetical protein
MLHEGSHEHPEVINCSEVIRRGGRVKAGLIEKRELQADYERGILNLNDEQVNHIHWDAEIRVSLRSSRFPSIELFTLRNVKPADYQLVLVAIPREKDSG